MKYLKLLFVICLLSSSGFASGQALKGVREVAILIESLDEDASKCGLSEDLLDAAARLTLSNSKIKVVGLESGSGYVYTRVTVLNVADICIGHLEVSYHKFATSEKQVGEFWRKGKLISRAKMEFSKVISQDAEAYAKQFLSAWLKANQ